MLERIRPYLPDYRRMPAEQLLVQLIAWAGGGGTVSSALVALLAKVLGDLDRYSSLDWYLTFAVGAGLSTLLFIAFVLWRYFAHGPNAQLEVASNASEATSGHVAVDDSLDADVPEREALQKRLYVGEMTASLAKLMSDNIIEIVVRGFNATGEVLWVHRTEGAARIEIYKQMDDVRVLVLEDTLPAATIRTDVFELENIGNFSEIVIALEQRVSNELASEFLTLESGDQISLLFSDKFTIFLGLKNTNEFRLEMPLWGGMTLKKVPPDEFRVGRIAAAKVAITL